MAADSSLDLDDARQREIADLEAKIDSANLFEFLGVPAGADVEAVKAAFREASRKFHPDKYFGKNLGPYRVKLDRVFKRLVEANQTLSDPAKREAYLASNPAVMRAAQASGLFPSFDVKVKSAEEEARDAERRARLARHPYLARASKVQELLTLAKADVAKAEYSLAFSHLNAAAQIDPNNTEVKLLLGEVRRKADIARAESSYKHAMDALDRGDEELALQALKGAVAANAAHHQAAYKAAQMLVRRSGDAREATGFAQKAVEADPKNVEYRLLLARLLADAGMKALAKKHYEEAHRLAPDHPEVKKHGKRLWPF